MSELSVPISSAQTTVEAPEKRRSWLNFDNRFLAPLFITCILLAGFIGKAIGPKAGGVAYSKER